MGDLDKSALTFYNGGTPIRKGVMDVKLDCLRRFLLQRLGISISIATKLKWKLFSYTEVLFQPVQ
jgi:hypothetical protein